MQAEIQIKFNDIDHTINILKKHFNWENSINRVREFNDLVESQNFWDDTIKAQSIMKEKKQLEKTIDQIRTVQIEKDNLFELIELAEQENDNDLIDETIIQVENLAKICNQLQLESLLSGEADANNCYIEIHAGAGGTEAQDWALMLQRMYSRWSDKRGFVVSSIEESSGDEAGIKSCTLLLEGFASPVTLISNSIFDPKISLLSNSIDDEGELGLFVVYPGGRVSFQ